MSEERKPLDKAEPFSAMASRIRANASESFGGAFVFIPPGEEGAVASLILDSRQDPGTFWANVKAVVEAAIEELDRRQRQQYGVR